MNPRTHNALWACAALLSTYSAWLADQFGINADLPPISAALITVVVVAVNFAWLIYIRPHAGARPDDDPNVARERYSSALREIAITNAIVTFPTLGTLALLNQGDRATTMRVILTFAPTFVGAAKRGWAILTRDEDGDNR